MLRWALVFLIISLVAAVFGYSDISQAAAGIAKAIFFVFIVLCLAAFALGLAFGRKAAG